MGYCGSKAANYSTFLSGSGGREGGCLKWIGNWVDTGKGGKNVTRRIYEGGGGQWSGKEGKGGEGKGRGREGAGDDADFFFFGNRKKCLQSRYSVVEVEMVSMSIYKMRRCRERVSRQEYTRGRTVG